MKRFFLFLNILILLFALAPAISSAANLNNAFRVDYGDVYTNDDRLDNIANNAGYNILGNSRALTPEYIISTVITAVLSIIGLVFIAIIFYAGIQWMTASGNEEKVSKAKRVITESLIGLAIVVGAYAISYFVMNFFVSSGRIGLSEGDIPTTTVPAN